MVKENKEFFLYILGIFVLFFLMLFVLDYISPGIVSTSECGFLNFKCWFVDEDKKVYEEAPEMTIDTTKDYTAVISTNLGDLEVDLYEKNAPKAVNNFIFLVNDDYYDGVKFHRVIKGLLIQTGDRNTLDSDDENDGLGGPGYTFEDEINWESLDFSEAKKQQLINLGYKSTTGINSEHLKRRSVAMANSGSDSNGSQFFIVTADSNDPKVKNLDGRHTVFGSVTSSWDTIAAIENVEVDDPTSSSPKPLEDIIVIDVVIQVK
jgi:cyclophilin family peptidyl-prolyl cis-trans isomerase